MAQVNITIDELMVSNLDRISAARGLRRPELLRMMMQEMIEAHDAGRLAFELDDGPRLDLSLSALTQQLREAVTELDRAQREQQKLTKRYLSAWNGGEEVLLEAQQKLSLTINSHLREGFEPFRDSVLEVQSQITNVPQHLVAGLESKFATVEAKLNAVHQLASTPRSVRNIIFGKDFVFETKFISKVIASGIVIGAMLLLILLSIIPPIARHFASFLIADTEQFCRVIDKRYAVADCKVPEHERIEAVSIIKVDTWL